MQVERTILLTIVAERILEPQLKELVEQAGAEGYTIVTVQGKGKHGEQTGPMSVRENIQITLVVPRRVADAIVDTVEKNYARSYGILAFMYDVDVIRWTPSMNAAR